MNKELQYEKINHKIELISELIETLVEYNNIEGYTNQKRFTININYRTETNNPYYYYSVNITRGTNRPKNVFNMRFIYVEDINEILKKLVEKLISNKYFSYTSYSTSSKQEGYSSYNINLKNGVVLELGINQEKDLEMYSEIEKNFSEKKVIITPPEESNKTKDELQEDKIIKTIDLFQKIMNILEKYNSIDDYNNKKPFKLKISNSYYKEKECYTYTFTIVRGDIAQEKVLTLTASIKDNKMVYGKIFDLIMDLKSQEKFLFDMITTRNGAYEIRLKDSIAFEFDFNGSTDEKFYSSFMNETGTPRSEYDLLRRKNKILNTKE